MTAMIAVPSFFLGTALGVSSTRAAILIFVAIMLHKSAAAFALSLRMVRSTMTRWQVWIAFMLFAFSTPLGIIVGPNIHEVLGPEPLNAVKELVLALAAGTFLYMATLHEFRYSPMIARCNTPKGFAAMLAGFFLTAFVRYVIGEAHGAG
jgi:zinc transporter ZupT